MTSVGFLTHGLKIKNIHIADVQWKRGKGGISSHSVYTVISWAAES